METKGIKVKNVAFILLILFLALTIYQNGCKRAEMEAMVGQMAELYMSNDSLKRNIKDKDNEIAIKDARIVGLKDSISLSIQKFKVIENRYIKLKGQYSALSDSVASIPTDSSYRFLTSVAYPYEGIMKYPFNEPQVKCIHLTFLEKKSLGDINYNLIAQVKEKDYQLEIKDTIISEQERKGMIMELMRTEFETIINNSNKIIDINNKEIKKERRQKTMWQITTGAVVIGFSALHVGG